ncbi:nudix hydrolase 7-like isoform X1 [Nymphaea colorata]|nr:nudix hydrolase 7-like isoform X1 [Nymphaea colorata]XP_031492666.1 nudix hydrolase 7-like isoform X1 [Nymphaea colorata]XP_031492667.1 nudix hydrolase 7-like isoform X1 [Nymphaea colorata]XP_031492668.1 nudix hydrolase 7-like isoform X1 [Nymphaea colorata]XP_031492670.1 nudix hydrolase 7-like isoform X1 [Nymphaea colorata]XP_031492672.1 nudix hydrolase 7-like isoform X1 [Nymphaea colorata]XP_031492673.1 nudix hydrolase 7-like isoform X1 [Nymphaea colorata]XP_031492674.1 nudix hydrolase 7
MSVPTTSQEEVEVLVGEEDLYDGVTVTIKEQIDVGVFVAKLRASLTKWKEQRKKGIWLNIPCDCAKLVPAAIEEGFRYHHAEPTYLMLVKWLPDTPNVLPIYATHRLGIGAVVINNKKEVLVVQEKAGYFKGSGVWKLPTGVVEEGEDISTGAKREVMEETGIEAEFVEILGFRESHKAHFNKKSDLFFVCMLEPKTYAIVKQDSEIADAQWMPVEEYASQPYVQKHESLNIVANMVLAKTNSSYRGFGVTSPSSSSSTKKHNFYLNNSTEN